MLTRSRVYWSIVPWISRSVRIATITATISIITPSIAALTRSGAFIVKKSTMT